MGLKLNGEFAGLRNNGRGPRRGLLVDAARPSRHAIVPEVMGLSVRSRSRS